MTNLFINDFIEAINDYFFLINKDYSKRVVLKVVADRYKLNHDQKTILYRGILHKNFVIEAKSKTIKNISDNEIICIDGFNVLFRIVHYLLGRPLFISNDGLLRDAGHWEDKLTITDIFKNSLRLLVKYLNSISSKEIFVYMDNRFNSEDKNEFENLFSFMNNKSKKINLIWSNNVDNILKNKDEGVVATSDSEIILKTKAKVFDLSRMILEKEYKVEFINIEKFIKNFN